MSYLATRDYRWEFYPPPYQFMSPVQPPQWPWPVACAGGGCGLGSCQTGPPIGQPKVHTHGCGDCGCGCGGSCGKGLGLFESGFDLSQWGIGEWSVVGVGAYVLMNLFSDFGKVRKKVRRYQSRGRRREQLQRELSSI